MSQLINTNEHRIYYGKDAANVARAGDTFEGSASDADRPGIVKADSDEGKAFLASRSVSDDTSASDRKQRVSDVDLLGRSLATAPLRDKLDPATGDTIKGTGEGRLANQPSAGGPAEVVPDSVEDPNQPAPATADTAAVSTGAPGHDELAGPREHTAPAILERLADSNPASEAASSNEPNFASPQAAEKADELGVDPSTVKGTGADGAITVKDVKDAASS